MIMMGEGMISFHRCWFRTGEYRVAGRRVVNWWNTMCGSLWLAVFLAICTIGCTVDQETADYTAGGSGKRLTAADVGHCPKGHYALKEVPIIGGMWITPEIER